MLEGFKDMFTEARRIIFGYTEEEQKQVQENFKKVEERIKVNEDFMSKFGLGYNPFLSPFIKENEKTKKQEVDIPALDKAESMIMWVAVAILAILVIKD
jgi:hypothetical protein